MKSSPLDSVASLSDASKLQLLSKRQVRRWFEGQSVAHLSTLDHWLYGFLVRMSHPKPVSNEQATEFERLVILFRKEQPEIRKTEVVMEAA